MIPSYQNSDYKIPYMAWSWPPEMCRLKKVFTYRGARTTQHFPLKSRFRQNQLHNKNLLEKRLITIYIYI